MATKPCWLLLPILILVLLFYPNVDREPTKDVLNADISAAVPTAEPERFPKVGSGLLLVYRHRLHFLECLVYELLRLHRQ